MKASRGKPLEKMDNITGKYSTTTMIRICTSRGGGVEKCGTGKGKGSARRAARGGQREGDSARGTARGGQQDEGRKTRNIVRVSK
jgi:hypothetical protein